MLYGEAICVHTYDAHSTERKRKYNGTEALADDLSEIEGLGAQKQQKS